jgi:protein-tyrosine phosphatase
LKPKCVLFLCTGNFYRSRFAEYLFNHLAEKHQVNWRADSRGLRISGRNVGPLSVYTSDELARLAIVAPDVDRFPLALCEADLLAADHVVAVKQAEHWEMVAQDFPQWLTRIEFWHIDDIDCASPEEALPLLLQAVQQLFDRLTQTKD